MSLGNDSRARPARSADLEHFGSALGALAFGRGPAVLHRDLHGVFDLTFGLTLDAIGFCCHLRILQSFGLGAAPRIRVRHRASYRERPLAAAGALREGFTVDAPEYTTRAAFEAVRGERGLAWDGLGLWSCGSLAGLGRPSVALVGTRAATPYGRRLARTFARDLGAAGCAIVSGLALGIDAAAHEGALDAGAPTIGVLGSGHNRFFPRRNLELARRIVDAQGAVLSPFPPEQEAAPWHFLARNAIVAALADAVVVIEAPARSGALNTAGWAAPRIPVLAVPGDVDRTHVAGCHALIRDGAILARSAADVLEVLHLTRTTPLARPQRDGPPGALLDALSGGECNLDDLVDATGLAPAQALAELAILELEGVVERRGATRFACSSG